MAPTDRTLWARASALFDELADLPEAERAGRLAALAVDSPELGRELATLLAADERGDTRIDPAWLEAARGAARDLGVPPAQSLTSAAEEEARPAARAGSRVGDFRILSRLGSGGMGEVWAAERADGQFEQRVAVKFLRRGFDEPGLVARFVRERQILARLEHPGITRLLDGGICEDGQPYLVMELVEGEPITDFAAERALGLRERVELALQVADAVVVAHRALVIHRDLKPSNILVDDSGRAKLLDFGIAKLLDDDDPAQTVMLPAPFTPAYASPEQISGGAITTACDVYALGVVLYELLAERRPFERHGRQSAELLAEIEREDVDPPSRARAGGAGGIDADLDAIVLRAIGHDVEERYPTVDALAAELRRWLAGEPVEARGNAFAYRARKLFRRHRLALGAALVMIVALVAGAALAFWQAARATREAERARQVERFLVDIFAQADPSRTIGERLSARQVLDLGAARITSELAAEPWAGASLEEALSRSYRGLGLLDEARQHATRALALREQLEGAGSAAVASARVTLAEALLDAGDLAAAKTQIEAARTRLEAGDAQPAERLRALAAESSLLFQEGDYRRAQELDREIFEGTRALRGDDHPETAMALQERALGLAQVGEVEPAAALLADAIGRMGRAGQAESPVTGVMHTNLADVLDSAGRSAEAEEHFRTGLALEERGWGPDHPEVAQTLLKYGVFLVSRRRYTEAEAALTRAAPILEALHHYDLANAWRYLGYTALAREQYETAERWFAAAEAKLRHDLGDDHPLTWAAVVPLAQARARLGRLEEAEKMQREAVAAIARLHGESSYEIRVPLKNLGETLRRRGRLDEALELHRRVLTIERAHYGNEDNAAITGTKRLLAQDLLERPTAPNLDEARQLVDGAVAFLRATPAERGRLPEMLETSGRVAMAAGDRERARRELAEAVALWAADPEPDPEAAAAARRTLSRLGP